MKQAALLADLAGLSHREAAEYLEIRYDTVASWYKGKAKNASAGLIAELKALIQKQERAAAQAIAQIEDLIAKNAEPECVEIGFPTDDYEAQELGFPCVGAWRAMAARVVTKSPIQIKLVPRGSTLVTAAAIEAHNK